MKILLHDPVRRLFYAGPEQWTKEHNLAVSFPNTAMAIDHAIASSLQGMEIVMRFEDPEFEIPLTIEGANTATHNPPETVA